MIPVLFEPFTHGYMQRALVMVLILGVIGAVVGAHVLMRRLAFLTEALQHTVFPGIVIAFILEQSLLLGAFFAAVLTVLLFSFAVFKSEKSQDAVLAVLISGFFGLGVIVVSRSGGYQHDLTSLLFGRILEVDKPQLIETALLGILVVGTVLVIHKELIFRAFDVNAAQAAGYKTVVIDLVLNLAVAITVIAAVRAVGTVLLVAFIVTPIAAGRLVFDRVWPMVVFASLLTSFCGWIGLGISYHLSVHEEIGVAPGATVVLAITACFLVVAGAVAVRSRSRAKAIVR